MGLRVTSRYHMVAGKSDFIHCEVRFVQCREFMKFADTLKTAGTVATWFFGRHDPTYLKIAKPPERSLQERGPGWDKMWTEVGEDGKTLGRRILEAFWAEDR